MSVATPTRNPLRDILAALLCAVAVAFPSLGDEKKIKPTPVRRYQQGPLRLEDFRGKPTDGLTTSLGDRPLALTATRIHFTCRYQLDTRGNRATARLTSIDIFAVVMTDESWYERSAGKALLDHEQGHFDITQASALRARLKFQEMLRTSRVLETSGSTNKAAIRQLSHGIEKLLQPFEQEATLAHQEYDRITGHGSRRRTQLEQRRVQTETLRRLGNELETLPTRAAPSRVP